MRSLFAHGQSAGQDAVCTGCAVGCAVVCGVHVFVTCPPPGVLMPMPLPVGRDAVPFFVYHIYTRINASPPLRNTRDAAAAGQRGFLTVTQYPCCRMQAAHYTLDKPNIDRDEHPAGAVERTRTRRDGVHRPRFDCVLVTRPSAAHSAAAGRDPLRAVLREQCCVAIVIDRALEAKVSTGWRMSQLSVLTWTKPVHGYLWRKLSRSHESRVLS